MYSPIQTVRVLNLGVVIGADGKDGTNGIDGKDGINGTDGKDGKDGVDGTNGTDGVDGKDGINGINGTDGISITASVINNAGELILTYSDGTTANLGVIVGKNGTDGADGVDGKDGADGKDGVNGKDGVDGTDGKDGQDGIGITTIIINDNSQLEITLSNGTQLNLGTIKDADGQNGSDGANGTDGIGILSTAINSYGELVITYSDGTTTNLGVVVGSDGKDGVNGTDGKDGQDGQDGKDGFDGQDGTNGVDGISVIKTEINDNGELVISYSDGTSANLGIVVGANGKDGINGTDGKDGADGEDGIGISDVTINNNGELVLTFSDGNNINLGNIVGKDGQDGKDGTNGADGKDGVDGTDGIGIEKSEINADGELVITYTDGTSETLGVVVGADGKNGVDGKDGTNGTNGKDGIDGINGVDGEDGIGIEKTEINSDGELVVYYTDGTSANLGVVVGADGKNGSDGKDGVGIKTVTVSSTGELIVTLTDNSVTNLGNIKGEKGDKGDKGDKGEDGRGIASMEIVDGELMVTYTDSDTAVSVGKVNNTGNGVLDQDGGTPELAYYPFLSNAGNLRYRVAIGNATSMSDIVIPSYHNGAPVTSIAEKGFSGVDANSITIPSTITYFNASIWGTGTIQNIYYNGTMEDWVSKITFATTTASPFSYDENLYIDGELITDIVIPDGTTKINQYCFYCYNAATRVVIPTSVTSIGTKAFYSTIVGLSRNIYYKGTASQFKQITLEDNWKCDKDTVFYYSATKPTTSGNYWHYVNNVPTVW